MKIDGKLMFVAVIFIAAVSILVIKMLGPAQIQIIVEGNETSVTPISEYFTMMDVFVMIAAAIIAGVCGTYLLFFESYSGKVERESEEEIGRKREAWEHTMKTLKDDEKTIYEAIFLECGLMYQSDLIEETGFSSAKVSRCLENLENRGLLERKRKGMGNIVLLR